jgi:hypothetical protein
MFRNAVDRWRRLFYARSTIPIKGPRDEKIKINDPELLSQFELIAQLNAEGPATIKNVIKAMIMKNQMEKVISQ